MNRKLKLTRNAALAVSALIVVVTALATATDQIGITDGALQLLQDLVQLVVLQGD